MKLKIVAILAGMFLVAAMLMPGGSSVNVKKIYEEAEKALQEGKYQEAVDKYALAMEEGERWGANTHFIDEDFDSLARYKIAVCYAELGKQMEDLAMYEKSLGYIPEIYEKARVDMVREGAIFLWGSNYYRMEQYEEAEPKFRELLNDYPDSQFAENAYYSLGHLYYELKQYEPSREAFRMVLQKFPNSNFIDDAQYLIGRCFFEEANYNQAYSEFEKVRLIDDPTLVEKAGYYAGLSLLNMGRNQEALTAYQKFIADFPNSLLIPAVYFDMGTIHGKLKEYDEATRNYEQAIQHTKDDMNRSEIQFQIGNNYLAQEDYQSAITAYRKLMEEYPESVNVPEARYMIPESYWGLKDYENALAGYTEVLQNESEGERVIRATLKVGECYYNIGDKELALEWYQRVIDNYPDSPLVKDAIYGKIWALNELARHEEAEQAGRDYVSKYKEDKVYDVAAAEIQTLLGDIKFDAEEYISAADEYLRVASDYPDLPKFDLFKSRSLLQGGLAYYNEAKGNSWDVSLLSEAAKVFEQLLDDYEKNFDKSKREFEPRADFVTRAIINLGLSYSRMKEFEKAREALDMMTRDNPEYGRAMVLKGETYSDEGRVDDAIAVHRQMVDDESLSATWRSSAAIQMANMLRDAGRHAEAAAEYQRIAEEYADSEYVSTAMYLLGLSYYETEPKTPENMSKAIEVFRKVLEEHSESEVAPWSHLGIVSAYEASGAYDMVVKVAEEIEKKYLGSDIPDARRVIDSARRQKVDAMQKLEKGVSTDDLIAELRKVVDDPVGEEQGKASAQMRIGDLLFSEERYEEAIGEYESLLERFPGKYTGPAYHQIAAAAYWIEDYQKSLDSASKGLMEEALAPELRTRLNYILGLAHDRMGSTSDSIEALKRAIQSGQEVREQQTQDTVFLAHRGLAGVYVSAGRYEEAVKEYEFLAENSVMDSEKADAYFRLARMYEENLNDYEDAVRSYEQVIQLNTSHELIAQSLYYSGLIYSKHLKDDSKALSAFDELTHRYSGSEDPNVQSMAADANLRAPELLITLGQFDDALARARRFRDAALSEDDSNKKVNAQYQLAYLLGERANQIAESGSPDPDLSRQAAAEYAKVYELAELINGASDEIRESGAASLYNAGYLLYGLKGYEDYRKAVECFQYFTRDFPESDNYSTALELLGFASFEMARLKADLDGFATAAEYFLKFASEFPDHEDAAMAQFQAGEAYFAVGGGYSGSADETPEAKEASSAISAYEKAASAYRGVVNRYPGSEYAPEALYAMAACYTYAADMSADDASRQRNRSRSLDTYRELSEKYPQSQYAASAFLSVGNDYYNQASAPNRSTQEKTDLYRKSLDNYKRALQVPGVESKTRAQVESYIRETEELLARDIYIAGSALVPYEADLKTKTANAPKAVAYFREVIDALPNTDYADLSYVQLGLCYEYLEKWEEAEDAYGELIKKYTDKDGNPVTPFSENVLQALRFARDRKARIMVYRLSILISDESQRKEAGTQ